MCVKFNRNAVKILYFSICEMEHMGVFEELPYGCTMKCYVSGVKSGISVTILVCCKITDL
jgi:hypothetical protein